MRLYPDFAEFSKLYSRGEPQAVWTRLIADLETPVSAMLKLAHAQPMSFLLESVEGGAVRGRYSIIGFAPDLIWRAHGDAAEINRSPSRNPDKFEPCEGGTLAAFLKLILVIKLIH
jgi:anthranilate synthase component 1